MRAKDFIVGSRLCLDDITKFPKVAFADYERRLSSMQSTQQWAMNLMLINVSTRKLRRAVRLPEGDVPAPAGAGVSKSAASRHFVALSATRMKQWMASDLGGLDIMVVQIDGIHITEHLVLVAAIWIDGEGVKHPLGLIEGATEHGAVVQALIDDLVERGLDPTVPRLFIIDGSKALAKAIRRSFGRQTARRLEHEAPGVSKSILEGLDEILTVSRLGLPTALRRSLACTNIIENMMGTVRQVSRNVKRWQSASMALRWTAAAMLEAKKGFRRLKAYKQLPALRTALAAHYERASNNSALAQKVKAA
jgi:putative transposase